MPAFVTNSVTWYAINYIIRTVVMSGTCLGAKNCVDIIMSNSYNLYEGVNMMIVGKE